MSMEGRVACKPSDDQRVIVGNAITPNPLRRGKLARSHVSRFAECNATDAQRPPAEVRLAGVWGSAPSRKGHCIISSRMRAAMSHAIRCVHPVAVDFGAGVARAQSPAERVAGARRLVVATFVYKHTCEHL